MFKAAGFPFYIPILKIETRPRQSTAGIVVKLPRGCRPHIESPCERKPTAAKPEAMKSWELGRDIPLEDMLIRFSGLGYIRAIYSEGASRTIGFNLGLPVIYIAEIYLMKQLDDFDAPRTN